MSYLVLDFDFSSSVQFRFLHIVQAINLIKKWLIIPITFMMLLHDWEYLAARSLLQFPWIIGG